ASGGGPPQPFPPCPGPKPPSNPRPFPHAPGKAYYHPRRDMRGAFAASLREDHAMKPRLLIPLLLLPVACGPKEPPASTASAAPPTTMAMAPSPSGQTLVVEVVTVDAAAPSITLRAGDVPAGTPKASDL